jgi:hypothetical protein
MMNAIFLSIFRRLNFFQVGHVHTAPGGMLVVYTGHGYLYDELWGILL